MSWVCTYETAKVQAAKKATKKRDGNRCVGCGMTNRTHKRRYGRSLHVHRREPGSPYLVEKCVTLCYGCHHKEHVRIQKDRERLFWAINHLDLVPAEQLARVTGEDTNVRDEILAAIARGEDVQVIFQHFNEYFFNRLPAACVWPGCPWKACFKKGQVDTPIQRLRKHEEEAHKGKSTAARYLLAVKEVTHA
jgi:hypothetical protein